MLERVNEFFWIAPFEISRKPKFNQKNSSMLCIGVKKIKIHFDTSQLCCGVVHSNSVEFQRGLNSLMENI